MGMTYEQSEAVKARGRVVVSASAGSGKTTVMISRLADILEEGATLDEVLAVTFTKKAAAQMKSRLRTELIKRLDCKDEEKRENIRVQLGKINSADICTIHSFCSRLVRTYFYVLGVSCAFEVLSDTDAETLRNSAVNELFDRLYAEKDGELYTLLSKLRKKRSDDGLKKLILSSYDEVRKHPHYEKYLGELSRAVFTDEGFERVCMAYAQALGLKCRALAEGVERFSREFKISWESEKYSAILSEMRSSLLAEGDSTLFRTREKLYSTQKPRKNKNTPAEAIEADAAFVSFRDGVVKRYNALYSELDTCAAERERFLKSGEIARAFVSILRQFDGIYSGVKKDECKLDYGDLEQFALKLLTDGAGETDVRAQINAKYKYVFVDEYQDVNPIQDEIIEAVAKGDLFCVGDVKQAIYGFRGSRSRFFAEKCKSEGVRHIVLPDNFRSSSAVIDFVNGVFSTVMKPPVCGLDYELGHRMRGGSMYPEDKCGVAEICIFNDSDVQRVEGEGVYSVVAQNAVQRAYSAEGLAVLQLVEEELKSVRYDPAVGGEVSVQPGNICVLTRKRGNDSVNEIIRTLTVKYPVAGEYETNVCDRPEIIRLLNVLSYIDNSEQDIPLAATLLSPLGGLDEKQLARVRVSGGTGRQAPSFRQCAATYAATHNDGIAQLLKRFFAEISRLKSLSECVGAARLIDEIITSCGFSTEYDTEIKLGALRRLQQEAYSPAGELFLSAFLARIKSSGYNLPAPRSLAADCIKVMTMHSSKGLEFPVVIVADASATFKGDDKNEMLFDEEFGFAPRYYCEEDRTYCNTVLRKLSKLRSDREDLDNEINLFYVACTRAGYALHVLCSDPEKYDFIRANFASAYSDLFDVNAFSHRILPEYQLTGEMERGAKVLDVSRADSDVLEKLQAVSSAVYPYAAVTELPVKDSASHIISIKEGEQYAHTLFKEFESSDPSGSIERGVAYHRFLQLCDFSVNDESGIKAELAKFVYEGLLTRQQRELLNTDELIKILSMPVFAAKDCREEFREREFLMRISSSDYANLSGGANVCGDSSDGVIIQGAIDLLFLNRLEGKVVSADVVDYKYTGRSDSELIAKYSPQLALYKSAVCKAYGLEASKVTTTVINLRKQKQIDIT